MPRPPRAAIVGASGFVGSRLAEWLVLHDLAEVRPIVRSFKGMARLARFDLDCRVSDATDSTSLQRHLEGCEVLFHCVVGGRDTILKSAESAYRAAAGAGVRRLVYLSSAVVHAHDPVPGTNDDSPLIRRQPFEYNVSKVMAECLLRRLRADGAVEVVTLRPYVVFGPRSQWWTAQIASDMLSGKAYLVDDGSGVCNTVYVDNLVQAMWLAALSERARSQDFIVTDGQRVTWRDLYASVARAVGVDMADVTCISSETALQELQNAERRRRASRIAHSRLGRALKEILPVEAVEAVKRRLKASHDSHTDGAEAPRAATSIPDIDAEIVSLQGCKYVLPIEKARELLGYEPRVTFSEACSRTEEWLRFAFGRTHSSRITIRPGPSEREDREAALASNPVNSVGL